MLILTVFSTSFLNIIRAGNRTKAVNVAEGLYINEPIIVEKKDIDVKLRLSNGTTTVKKVAGSMVKGKVLANESSQVNVEILVFVPGLTTNDEGD